MLFTSNEDCAIALFRHLKNIGEIEGSDSDRATILHDINNLRGSEWLQTLERNQITKPFFDYIGFPEFFGDEFVCSQAISPRLFLTITVGQDYPEETSFDEVRDVLDEHGFSELWDYPTDEIDEATNNLGDDMYLMAVSFYEPDGYFTRVFEITEEMAEKFWRYPDKEMSICVQVDEELKAGPVGSLNDRIKNAHERTAGLASEQLLMFSGRTNIR